MYVLNKKDMEIVNTVYMNLFNIEFFLSFFFLPIWWPWTEEKMYNLLWNNFHSVINSKFHKLLGYYKNTNTLNFEWEKVI